MTSKVVRTVLGSIAGVRNTLPNGKGYLAFRGVPYAKPPVKELRFQAPVALESFGQTVLDCTNEGETSIHRDALKKKYIGSEDCLYMNIYAPENIENVEKKRPVMVWIHGGGFLYGSGRSDLYAPICRNTPETLIQNDVIVVTINYRLGPLGFLSLPEAGISGNAGLKDQLLALKCINQIIEQFGGDPNNVTLFGQSAGGVSTGLHVLSPESRKYFHKAICQSGFTMCEWGWQRRPEARARKLAELLGFKSESDKEIGEFLTQAPAEEMVKLSLHTMDGFDLYRSVPMPFRPVVETESEDHPFLTADMLETNNIQNSIQIPMMIGYNEKEGMMLLSVKPKVDLLQKSLKDTLPSTLNIKSGTEAATACAEEIGQFYFAGDADISQEKHINSFIDLMSDYYLSLYFVMAAERHARTQHNSNLYFYQFGFEGRQNIGKLIFGRADLVGASHADEYFYLFDTNSDIKKFKADDKATSTREKMCRMWSNFAKFGNPTPNDDTSLSEKWLPVKSIAADAKNFDLDYLDIGSEFKMRQNPNWDRVKFWKSIYEKYNGSFLNPILNNVKKSNLKLFKMSKL